MPHLRVCLRGAWGTHVPRIPSLSQVATHYQMWFVSPAPSRRRNAACLAVPAGESTNPCRAFSCDRLVAASTRDTKRAALPSTPQGSDQSALIPRGDAPDARPVAAVSPLSSSSRCQSFISQLCRPPQKELT